MAKITLDELAVRAKNGDEEAMLRVYAECRDMLRSMANIYFMIGADRDDVIQEGMIGLLSAIRTFDPAAGASFRTFAELCVKRNIINAVKMAGRKKHKLLNEYVSIDAAIGGQDRADGGNAAPVLEDTLRAPQATDPEQVVLLADLLAYVESNSKELFSKMERTVWYAYSQGAGAAQIAEKIGKSQKSVENALTRIKGKIENLVSSY